MEHSDTHTHDDDVYEFTIPAWVLWAAGGIILGLGAVIAWDVYTTRRTTAKLMHNVRTETATVTPLLDMKKVEEWANKAGKDEQPESPAL
jgi:hypothetical protein